jgi:hypothetical protein
LSIVEAVFARTADTLVTCEKLVGAVATKEATRLELFIHRGKSHDLEGVLLVLFIDFRFVLPSERVDSDFERAALVVGFVISF